MNPEEGPRPSDLPKPPRPPRRTPPAARSHPHRAAATALFSPGAGVTATPRASRGLRELVDKGRGRVVGSRRGPRRAGAGGRPTSGWHRGERRSTQASGGGRPGEPREVGRAFAPGRRARGGRRSRRRGRPGRRRRAPATRGAAGSGASRPSRSASTTTPRAGRPCGARPRPPPRGSPSRRGAAAPSQRRGADSGDRGVLPGGASPPRRRPRRATRARGDVGRRPTPRRTTLRARGSSAARAIGGGGDRRVREGDRVVGAGRPAAWAGARRPGGGRRRRGLGPRGRSVAHGVVERRGGVARSALTPAASKLFLWSKRRPRSRRAPARPSRRPAPAPSTGPTRARRADVARPLRAGARAGPRPRRCRRKSMASSGVLRLETKGAMPRATGFLAESFRDRLRRTRPDNVVGLSRAHHEVEGVCIPWARASSAAFSVLLLGVALGRRQALARAVPSGGERCGSRRA